MEIWVGEWKYEGKLSDTPFGPGGKFTGKQTSRLILDGLFLERSGEDVGVYAGKTVSYKFLGVQWFDSANKIYQDRSFDNDGTASEATLSVSGNVWKYAGTTTDPKGKTYKTRTTSTLSADGTTCVQKSEFSMDDGKTWKPFWEDTMKKTSK